MVLYSFFSPYKTLPKFIVLLFVIIIIFVFLFVFKLIQLICNLMPSYSLLYTPNTYCFVLNMVGGWSKINKKKKNLKNLAIKNWHNHFVPSHCGKPLFLGCYCDSVDSNRNYFITIFVELKFFVQNVYIF